MKTYDTVNTVLCELSISELNSVNNALGVVLSNCTESDSSAFMDFLNMLTDKIQSQAEVIAELSSKVLTEDEIKTFKYYIDSNDLACAFLNTDWNAVYSKIIKNKTR